MTPINKRIRGDDFTAFQIPFGYASQIGSPLDYARSKGNAEVIRILETAAKKEKKTITLGFQRVT